VSSRRRDQSSRDPVVGSRHDDDDHRDEVDDVDDVTIVMDDAELTADRAVQYQEWVERMRTKRAANQQRIRGTGDEAPPTYWRTEDLYRESQRVAAEEVPRRSDPLVQELLAVFGLSGQPTAGQIEAAFRRLAKEHHPDRHVAADQDVRDRHLDQMRRVNEAYARLRQLQLV
jgi:hypothetical protein